MSRNELVCLENGDNSAPLQGSWGWYEKTFVTMGLYMGVPVISVSTYTPLPSL